MRNIKFARELIDTTQFLCTHPRVEKFDIVGSSLIEGVDPKDLDFLVLTNCSGFLGAEDGNNACGAFGNDWFPPAALYDGENDTWGTLRRANVNLIVTIDPEWYARALVANEVCVALSLQSKADRIVVYRVVRDGMTANLANACRVGATRA